MRLGHGQVEGTMFETLHSARRGSARTRFSLLALRSACVLALAAASASGQASKGALHFGGTSSDQHDRLRIRIDDADRADASAPCDVGRAGFTIEFWLRGDASDNRSANAGGDVLLAGADWRAGNILIDRGIASGSGREFGVSIAGGFVRFGTGTGDEGIDQEHTLEGNVDVLDGAWHHVACARDRETGTLAIYVDGALDMKSARGVSTADLSYPDRGAGAHGSAVRRSPWDPYLVIGGTKFDERPRETSFDGYFDELRIWNAARTEQEIALTWRRLVPDDTPGLVADYRFEEESGAVVHDSSEAHSPDGELVNARPRNSGTGTHTSFATHPTNAAPVLASPLPPGFSMSVLSTTMPQATSLVVTPDGRVFIGELDGSVWIYSGGQLLQQPLIHIPAEQMLHSSGLLGLCLDPSFAQNGWIYAYYTTEEPRNRVGRFTVVGNHADPASEFVVWQNLNITPADHNGGGMKFAADGTLLIATGDQSVDAYVSDLTREDGKLLRVNADGTIPADNPFINVPSAAPTIYAIGFRNPFRIAGDSMSAHRWVCDVGSGGPLAWEEVNLVESGANYGWPFAEGETCYTTSCTPFTPASFAYRHGDPKYFYVQPQGCTVGGLVYRGTAFPPQYRGNLIVGDYSNRWLRRLILDTDGNVKADLPFIDMPLANSVVDMDVAPDGSIYMACFTGLPGQPSLVRLSASAAGNLPPVPIAAVTPTQGVPPLTVQFNGQQSFDPDHGPNPLAFDWDFGDGSHATTSIAQHRYTHAGVFTTTLTVDDGATPVSSTPLAIKVGTPPVPVITAPQPGLTYDGGDVIDLIGNASDLQDGTLPASALSWTVELVHANHTHPELGPVTGVYHTRFTVPDSGHPPENTFLRAFLTATDSDGLSATTSVDMHPNFVTLALDTNPSGVPLFVEGQSEPMPLNYQSIPHYQVVVEAQRWVYIAGNPWIFRSWSDQGDRLHTVNTPVGGESLVAKYLLANVTTIHTRVNAPNRNAQYAASTGQLFESPTEPHALWMGKPAAEQIQLALEFKAQIPRKATIISASIDFLAGQNSQGLAPVPVFGYDVADAQPFVAGSPTPLALYAPPTAAILLWGAESFSAGQSYETPDLSAMIQQIVDRSDWQPGNHIGVVFDGTTATGHPLRSIGNFDSAAPPQLNVTFGVLN